MFVHHMCYNLSVCLDGSRFRVSQAAYAWKDWYIMVKGFLH
jgi:hypothetical protein